MHYLARLDLVTNHMHGLVRTVLVPLIPQMGLRMDAAPGGDHSAVARGRRCP